MQSTTRLMFGTAAVVLLMNTAMFVYWCWGRFSAPEEHRPTPAALIAEPIKVSGPEALQISAGDTFEQLLLRAGVDRTVVGKIVEAVAGSLNVREFRAGSKVLLTRSATGAVEHLEYTIDADRKLMVSGAAGSFTSSIEQVPSTLRVLPVCGTMEGSLFESMQRIGERPDLAVQIAEIFKWDLDFYKDPQPGDEFCMVIEKREYANGQPPGYGRILSARYNNEGEVHEAFLFADAQGKEAWYSADGRSLESQFLRSPIRFEARVSSRFSHRRFHPVLRTYRPHLGTDYAVPTGTPVQAIADGQVVFSAYAGGSGNLVRIKHAQGYESQYLHLSRRLVRQGERIQQGQRIGLVGSTGLSTGAHLDLRISKNGAFQDFQKLVGPRRSKIEAARMSAFRVAQREYGDLMTTAAASLVAKAAAREPETVVD